MKTASPTLIILFLLVTSLLSGCHASHGTSLQGPEGYPWAAIDEEEAQFLRLLEVDVAQKIPEHKREKLTEFYIQRGQRYLADGKTEAATIEFQKALNLDPSSAGAKTYLESIRNETTSELLLPTKQEAIVTLPEYRLRFEDTLEISVWQYPELAKEVVVRPDGRISFPLVGDVWAYKLTPSELSMQLATMLSEYLRGPKVVVAVKKFASDRVIVLGLVNQPGIYDIRGTDKVLDAIALGGGFAPGAKKDVLLVRYVNRIKPDVTVIDAGRMLGGRVESLKNNLPLQHLDLVYVPKSTLVNIGEFVGKLLLPSVATLYTGAITSKEAEITRGGGVR